LATELRILERRVSSKPNKKVKELVPGKTSQLNKVKAGRWIKILAIQLANPSRGRLYDQGLIENRKARVIHNDFRGRVMLNLEGDIYLLGRIETPRIQVREYL